MDTLCPPSLKPDVANAIGVRYGRLPFKAKTKFYTNQVQVEIRRLNILVAQECPQIGDLKAEIKHIETLEARRAKQIRILKASISKMSPFTVRSSPGKPLLPSRYQCNRSSDKILILRRLVGPPPWPPTLPTNSKLLAALLIPPAPPLKAMNCQLVLVRLLWTCRQMRCLPNLSIIPASEKSVVGCYWWGSYISVGLGGFVGQVKGLVCPVKRVYLQRFGLVLRYVVFTKRNTLGLILLRMSLYDRFV